jgi:uncharacterized membrane protein YqgA involved in biofilm formation
MNLPIGTFVNMGSVVAGSILGVLLGNRLPEKIKNIVFQGVGLVTMILGISMALESENFILLIFSILIGGIIGEIMNLENCLESLSGWLKSRFKIKDHGFTEGLITAFLIFCVGSMTIVGSINEGINGDRELLLTKSVLDGFTSIALSSTFGIGVAMSVIPMFVFQGGLTVFAGIFEGFFSDFIITQLVATGGVLILGIGINLLDIKKIKVANMLPALAISVVLGLVV